MTYFIITLLTASAFAIIANHMKIPGGFMVGAIFGAAALGITTGMSYMPTIARTGAQMVAGAFIGLSIKRSDLVAMRSLVRPMLLVYSLMLVFNLVIGYMIYSISPLDLVTAFMCSIPGGMSDVPIIAADMGANSAQVAVVQFFRMVVAISVFPTIIANISSGEEQPTATEPALVPNGNKTEANKQHQQFLETGVIAVVSGLIGKWVGMPAGTLFFTALSVSAYQIIAKRAYLPRWVKRVAQIFSGAYIGSSIGLDDLLQLNTLIIPTLLVLLGYSLNCFLTGWLLNRHFGFTRREGMLAATPAGASDMALIASDIGVNSPSLAVMQTMRLFVTTTIFPQIIQLFLL